MATPAGTPNFGAIALPQSSILQTKSRTFAGVDGRVDRQEEQDLRIYGPRQNERLLQGLLDVRRALLRTLNTVLQAFLQCWPLLLFGVLGFCLHSSHILSAEPTLTYPLP